MASVSPAQARFDQRHPHFTSVAAPRSAATGPRDTIKLDLETLQLRLRQIVREQVEQAPALPALLEVALQLINANCVQYVELTTAGELSTLESVTADRSPFQQTEASATTALTAIRERRVHIARNTEQVTLAVPVNVADALVAEVTLRYGDVEPLVVSLQLVAAHVTLAELHQRARRLDLESQLACGLAEVIGSMQTHVDPAAACLVAATKIGELLSGSQIAIGLRAARSRRVSLSAVSRHSEFDARGEISGLLESAMAEARLHGRELTIWPPVSEAERAATLAHKKLAEAVQRDSVWSVLLKTPAGLVVGVLTVMGSDSDTKRLPQNLAVHGLPAEPRAMTAGLPEGLGIGSRDREIAFIRTAAPLLAKTLETLTRLRGGPLRRLVRRLVGEQPWSRAWRSVAASAIIAALLALPMQHRLKCEAVVQPESRRFAVAPYAGVLKQSVVKPGDVVNADDILAVMDDRELNWELAGLIADRDRASKQRDSNLASKQVAEMQMAQLETQRLQLKIALLEHRKENLEIRSPVDGVIIRGDLEDAEGAPVDSGQTLFEVAPLDDLRFDIAIQDYDISYVHPGMHVDLRLEALPGRVLRGTVARLHPQAEVQDAQNVFTAEVNLEVEDAALRPGMQGQARLSGSRRPLGWILFHRPWYRLVNYVR